MRTRTLQRGLLFFLLASYATFMWLAACNLIVDVDEAKYYTTIKETIAGNIPSVELHPGSTGSYFYYIHGAWGKLFGVSYETGRTLNIALTLVALTVMFAGLRRTFESNFIPFFWLAAFISNPYFATHSVQIGHHALSNALMLITFGLILFNFSSKKVRCCGSTFVALVAVSATIAADIRSYLWLVWGAFMLFLVLAARREGNRAVLRIVATYLVASAIAASIPTLVVLSFDMPQRYERYASLSSNTYPEFAATWGRALDADETRTIQQIERRVEEAKDILGTLHEVDLLYALHSLLRQAGGFDVNGQHILYLIPLILALFRFGDMPPDRKTLFIFSSFMFLSMTLPIFVFRYSQATSFSYFFQSMQFLLIASLFGVEIVSKQIAKTGCRIVPAMLVAVVGTVAIQNLLFLRPIRLNDSPTYSIFKRYGEEPSPHGASLYNLRQAAQVANRYINGQDSYFLTSSHAISPLLDGTPFPGTIMSIHRTSFERKNWDLSIVSDVAHNGQVFANKDWRYSVLKPEFNPSGTNVSYIVNLAIRNKKIALIADNGQLHGDVLPVIEKYYHVADRYGEYTFYVPK